jgi:hypothetical protein
MYVDCWRALVWRLCVQVSTHRTSENAFITDDPVAMKLKRRSFELLGVRCGQDGVWIKYSIISLVPVVCSLRRREGRMHCKLTMRPTQLGLPWQAVRRDVGGWASSAPLQQDKGL